MGLHNLSVVNKSARLISFSILTQDQLEDRQEKVEDIMGQQVKLLLYKNMDWSPG